MICPLAPVHIVAFAAFHIYAILFFMVPWLAPLPMVLFISSCFAAPFLPALGFYLPIISHGKRKGNSVALTFDDGPDPSVTPLLLKLLERHNKKATFFVTGQKAEEHPELIRSILAHGHTIGNHSYSHNPFIMLKPMAYIESEVASSQDVLRESGITPLAFRPPVGITGPYLWRVLLKHGMYCVNFSCRAFDGGNRNIARLAEKILAKVKGGDIILLHDKTPLNGDINALTHEFELLLQGLKRKGLEIIPLPGLIGKEVMRTDKNADEPSAAATFYNDLANGYDHEQFNTGVSMSRNLEYRLFRERLTRVFSPDSRVLEIGAGTGIFTLDIARQSKEVVALDISGNMLEHLKKKAAAEGMTNITPMLADVEQCRLEGSFSVVCAFSSLAYIEDLPLLLLKLSTHIEPGGYFYATTARRSVCRFFVQIGNAMRQGLWLRMYSKRELERIFQEAGFEMLEISDHLLKTPVTGGMLFELLARKK